MSARRCGVAVAVAGAVLLIVGILWFAVIFPALAKVPSGYERTYHFEGTFYVLNPATMSLASFPVTQDLAQEATGTEDGALLIHEKRTVINAGNGTDISATYGDESTLAIDRSTLEFVPTIDERGRTGHWGPPRGLGEGDEFDIWNPSANKPLTARYVDTLEFQGVKVVKFKIAETDLSIGNHPLTQAPLLLTTTVDLLIEPKTGTVVDQNALTTIFMDVGVQKVPVQVANVKWADDTISEMVDLAKSSKTKLLWFETVVPWLLVGVGAVLIVAGAAVIVRRGSEVPA